MDNFFRDLKASTRNLSKYYGFKKSQDENEQLYLEYAEKCRVLSNLQRTMFFSLFVIFFIIAVLVVRPIRTSFDNKGFFVLLIVGIVLTIGFVIFASKMYAKSNYGTFGFNKKDKHLIQASYVAYWSVYYLVTIGIILGFSKQLGIMAVWMPLVIMGFLVVVYNIQEGIIPMTFAGLSAITVIKDVNYSLTTWATIVPFVALVIIITDMNHIERVNAFFQEAKILGESSSSKRQLGNVFEEVYDMAFELNLRTDECTTLRNNDQYLIQYGKKIISKERFIGFVMDTIHPDDLHIAERILNTEYLENEFIIQNRSQIYNEVRLLSSEDKYVWTSVLFIREKQSLEGYDNDEYILCLVQNIEDRKKNEDRLKLEAERDPLTKLYNKMTTKSLIEEVFEKNATAQHALIVIDIDNFKTINDTRGHVVGDQILLAFANELTRNFRESDILGRTGGDEFIVLIKNIQSIALVCDKLQQLTSSFKKYGIDHGFLGRLSTSIGIAIYGKDGKTYEELFKKADAALYEAKRNGKDQYKFSITRS